MIDQLNSCLPGLFADDNSLVVSNELQSLPKTQINEVLSKVLTWYNANKVNLNPSKSNYPVISPSTQIAKIRII